MGTLTELLRSLAQALQDNEGMLTQSFGAGGLLHALQGFQVLCSHSRASLVACKAVGLAASSCVSTPVAKRAS